MINISQVPTHSRRYSSTLLTFPRMLNNAGSTSTCITRRPSTARPSIAKNQGQGRVLLKPMQPQRTTLNPTGPAQSQPLSLTIFLCPPPSPQSHLRFVNFNCAAYNLSLGCTSNMTSSSQQHNTVPATFKNRREPREQPGQKHNNHNKNSNKLPTRRAPTQTNNKKTRACIKHNAKENRQGMTKQKLRTQFTDQQIITSRPHNINQQQPTTKYNQHNKSNKEKQ